jgi:hypothetical protein
MHKAQSTGRASGERQSEWRPPFAMLPLLPFATGAGQADAVQRLFVDWSEFLHRRFSEDVRLWQRVSASRSPSDLVKAYSDFWQVAAEDYWKEYAAVGKAGRCLMQPGTETGTGPGPGAEIVAQAPADARAKAAQAARQAA